MHPLSHTYLLSLIHTHPPLQVTQELGEAHAIIQDTQSKLTASKARVTSLVKDKWVGEENGGRVREMGMWVRGG